MSQRLDHQIRTLRSLFWSPRDPEGRVFAPLAEAYLQAGDPGQALELVVEGLDRHPDFASGHLVAGRVFQATDDLDSGLLAFDRVLELDPENTAALLARARISEMQGQLQEAMSRYLRLDALSPGDPQVEAAIRKLEKEKVPSPQPEELPVAGLEEEPREQLAATYESLAGLELIDEPLEALPYLVPNDEPIPTADPAFADEFTLEGLDDESHEPDVRTRTMADLLARQGFNDRALEIYRHLLAEAPDDPELQARVSELAGGGTPDSPPPYEVGEVVAEEEFVGEEVELVAEEAKSIPPMSDLDLELDPEFAPNFDTEELLNPDTEEVEVSAHYEIIDLASTEDEELEPSESLSSEEAEEAGERELAAEDDDAVAPLAPQWMTDQDYALADQGSPFPWDPGLDGGEAEPDSSEEDAAMPPGIPSSPTDMKGRTAGAYLQDLLAWVPGAVSVESLAPASPPASGEPEIPAQEAQAASEESEPPQDDSDPPPDESEDDFQSWLQQLRP